MDVLYDKFPPSAQRCHGQLVRPCSTFGGISTGGQATSGTRRTAYDSILRSFQALFGRTPTSTIPDTTYRTKHTTPWVLWHSEVVYFASVTGGLGGEYGA